MLAKKPEHAIAHDKLRGTILNATLYISVGAALSQAVLMALLLTGGNLNSRTKKLFGLLVLAIISYLLIPVLGDWNGHWVLGAVSTLVPGAFWLFSASLFDDHYRFAVWQPVLVALSVLMPTIWSLFFPASTGWLKIVLIEIPQIAEFVFIGLAAAIIFRSWKDDLITSRRALRLWFCGILGLVILLIILAREVLFKGADWLGPIQYLVVAIAATGTNIILLGFKPDLLNPVNRVKPAEADPVAPEESVKGQDQLESVIKLVEESKLYREWGITIGRLAAAVDIQEYRLRQMINSGLGYRNFNDFLNRFRIQEASRRLADPNELKIPVLTIALEAGFRSISTFNKAFKEIHQVTPTVYRKQQTHLT